MNRFEQMKNKLKSGEAVQVTVAPLLYPTPPDIAERMVDLLDAEANHKILEPSAGTGNLLQPLETCGLEFNVTAVEIDRNLVHHLRKHFNLKDVVNNDFLDYPKTNQFDRIIMNPPFNGGADIKHIKHALNMLKPNGKLVAICSNGPRQNKLLKPFADHWEVLPAGTFKNAGTNVSTVLCVFELDHESGPNGCADTCAACEVMS